MPLHYQTVAVILWPNAQSVKVPLLVNRISFHDCVSSFKSFSVKSLYCYIIPHLILSFFMLYISSGRYFAIFCVILITPAAPVVICTKYGPTKWHSTFFFKDAYITTLFPTVRQKFYVIYH